MVYSRTLKFLLIFCVVPILPLHGKGTYYVPSPPGSRPPCARESLTFCENIDTYPMELIQKLLQKKPLEIFSLFSDERKGENEPPQHFLYQEAAANSTNLRRRRRARLSRHLQRRSNTITSWNESECWKYEKVSLETAQNVRGEWRFIAQDYFRNKDQIVTVQLCSVWNETCRRACTQKFKPVALLSLDPRGILKKDAFLIPSACIC